jgi:hypothetical protein
MERLLGSLPARVVTAEGRQWVTHGRALTAAQLVEPDAAGQDVTEDAWVRLIDQAGHLVALGRTTGATLHPSVVLI